MRSPVQIYEFIEDILNKRGISDRQMLTDAGLKRGVLDNMKKGSMPAADKIAAIAKYLGLSVDFLLGVEQNTDDIKKRAADIKRRFREETQEKEYFTAVPMLDLCGLLDLLVMLVLVDGHHPGRRLSVSSPHFLDQLCDFIMQP